MTSGFGLVSAFHEEITRAECFIAVHPRRQTHVHNTALTADRVPRSKTALRLHSLGLAELLRPVGLPGHSSRTYPKKHHSASLFSAAMTRA